MDDERQSRKLRQLQAEMIALANDREKATSAEPAAPSTRSCARSPSGARRWLRQNVSGGEARRVQRPTARTVVSEGRAHRFCSVECASSGVLRSCDGVASMASRWTYRFDAVGE